MKKEDLAQYWASKGFTPQVSESSSVTSADLIHAWKIHCKYNQPHPCRMPSPRAEAGRLILVYKTRALYHVLKQVKPTEFLHEVAYWLRMVGYRQ